MGTILRTVVSHNSSDTMLYGKNLSAHLHPGDCVLLYGNLGVGKTVLVKGIAKGLGIKETITSPTFTIVKEYSAAVKLFHIDLYRLHTSETADCGIEEYIWGSGISVVEWPERLDERNLKNVWKIYLRKLRSGTRNIRLKTYPKRKHA